MTRTRLVTMMKGAAGVILAAFSFAASAAYVCPTGLHPTQYKFSGISYSSASNCAPGTVTTVGGCVKTSGITCGAGCTRTATQTASVQNESTGAVVVTWSVQQTLVSGTTTTISNQGTFTSSYTPVCTCDGRAAPVDGQCPSTCSTLSGQTIAADYAAWSPTGTTVCASGGGMSCQATTTGQGSIGLALGAASPPTASTSFVKFTGQSCQQTDTPATDATARTKILPDQSGGVCTSDGSKCVSQTKPQCGYVNDEYRCVTPSQFQSSECVTTASGAKFCSENSPQTPDNGTPGQAAKPDATFSLWRTNDQGQLGQQIVNYYSSSTVNGSSQNPGSQGESGTGETDKNGNCGASGTPCSVKVDETGTPTTFDKTIDFDHDAAGVAVSGIGKSHIDTAGGEAASEIPTVPGGGSCESLSYTINDPLGGSHEVDFPSSRGCDAMHSLRDVFAWLFYLFTAYWCVKRVGESL